MNKFELLRTFCESAISRPEESGPVAVPWADQSRLLWPKAQYFAPWCDVAYASASELAADEATQDRVRLKRWKPVSPEAGCPASLTINPGNGSTGCSWRGVGSGREDPERDLDLLPVEARA
jgi:hypothetical protein